ncbi:sigma-70 family RNA polymerase sigma factor [Micromonospora sp. SL1-18]|uniref:sigma-70 family RNA polymerase sigma factor n=1 Tax=Micromonospora sp. SL1-18 TaxID=3399128 RepID=UPI003A4D3410
MEDFATHRDHLRAVAYRMLGSESEADDAVQEAWLRLARSDTNDIHNTRAWLTTVIARVCLDMLRSRTARREIVLDMPLPADSPGPEQEAILAESVGLALLVVLDTLTPAERLAFVLHDMFAVPFDEVAAILGRSTQAAKMLASRARHRVGTNQPPDSDLTRRRKVVEAFLAASRNGDFAALLNLLDPDVTARADASAAPSGTPTWLRGAKAIGRQALVFSHRAEHARIGLVDGDPAILIEPYGRLVTVLAFTITNGKIIAIDIIADPQRLEGLTDQAGDDLA